jgi:hypothetical protein
VCIPSDLKIYILTASAYIRVILDGGLRHGLGYARSGFWWKIGGGGSKHVEDLSSSINMAVDLGSFRYQAIQRIYSRMPSLGTHSCFHALEFDKDILLGTTKQESQKHSQTKKSCQVLGAIRLTYTYPRFAVDSKKVVLTVSQETKIHLNIPMPYMTAMLIWSDLQLPLRNEWRIKCIYWS